MGRRQSGSITRKRGLWYAVLSVGYDAKGSRAREWSRGHDTRREAERALAQMLIDDRRAKATKLRVGDLLRRYIAHVESMRRATSTIVRYRGLAATLKALHDEQVERLETGRVEAVYARLRADGLSETTIFHAHSLLRAASRWAARQDLILRSPVGHMAAPRRAHSDAEALTLEELERFLGQLHRTTHKHALLFALATGMRRGEVCGLAWTAVDFERAVVLVRESRYQVWEAGQGQAQGQKRTKSERMREVPLSGLAIEALRAERTRQEEWRTAMGADWQESGHVFTTLHGGPISPDALTAAFRYIAEVAGLRTTRLHDLRHTAATLMLASGSDPTTVARILGHSTPVTTLQVYGHVVAGRERTAISSIAEC